MNIGNKSKKKLRKNENKIEVKTKKVIKSRDKLKIDLKNKKYKIWVQKHGLKYIKLTKKLVMKLEKE